MPDAEEVISYQLPAYKSNGWLLYFGAFKKHFSLSCPPPSTLFQTFEEQLSRYKVSKSAVQFPLDEPVPMQLIADMARHRAAEDLDRSQARKKTGKATPRQAGANASKSRRARD